MEASSYLSRSYRGKTGRGGLFAPPSWKGLTLPAPCISESYNKIKKDFDFYIHISLWCLKRFCESLKGIKEIVKMNCYFLIFRNLLESFLFPAAELCHQNLLLIWKEWFPKFPKIFKDQPWNICFWKYSFLNISSWILVIMNQLKWKARAKGRFPACWLFRFGITFRP